MKHISSCVILLLCINLTLSIRDAYKASIISVPEREATVGSVLPLVREAAKLGADVVLLPPLSSASQPNANHYDETVNAISAAARQAHLYLVTHLQEPVRCHDREEVFRNSLVFDRQGIVISESRRPVSEATAKCNATVVEEGGFVTDFGVQFKVLMDEDLVLRDFATFRNVRNFLVTGPWLGDAAFLNAKQFGASWAFANDANVISTSGIYAGKAGSRADGSTELAVVELGPRGAAGEAESEWGSASSLSPRELPLVDLSQYILSPLEPAASAAGHHHTLCYDTFCCHFYVKTKPSGSRESGAEFGLAVFSGSRRLARGRTLGTQHCALVSSGLFKSTCVGCENSNSSTTFEKISISANFTPVGSAQFPMLSVADPRAADSRFRFHKQTGDNGVQVVLEISDANVSSFGIFGRDFSSDFEMRSFRSDEYELDFYGFIFNENVQEFCEYIWVRLRVLIFIVSIYVLEMM